MRSLHALDPSGLASCVNPSGGVKCKLRGMFTNADLVPRVPEPWRFHRLDSGFSAIWSTRCDGEFDGFIGDSGCCLCSRFRLVQIANGWYPIATRSRVNPILGAISWRPSSPTFGVAFAASVVVPHDAFTANPWQHSGDEPAKSHDAGRFEVRHPVRRCCLERSMANPL